MTLSDVAKAAGVSMTQASRALADYDDVAETTRRRVRRLAKQLGYRPSQRARTLSMGRQAAVRCAILSIDMPALWLEQSSYGPILAGVLDGTAAQGMDVHFVAVESGTEAGQLPEQLTRFVAEDRADAIVVFTTRALRPVHLAPLALSAVPYVLVNRHFEHLAGAPAVNCVTPDWVSGTRSAVEHLHQLGHRDLVALFPRSRTSTVLDHEQGWTDGVRQSGIASSRAPILRYDDSAGPEAIVRRLLLDGLPKSGRRPTAVVAFNDHIGATVLRLAREASVAVPDQLSVVGFDNTVVAQHVWPALCSYDPHFFQIGQQAVRLVAELVPDPMATAGPHPHRRVLLPVDLVCRDSCAVAP